MRTNLENPVFLNLEETEIKSTANDEAFVQLPFNDKYFVSNYGRLYSSHRNRLLQAQLYGDKEIEGQPRLSYKLKDQHGRYKNYKAHRLVAEVFIENPDPVNKTSVHHKDKDPFNNYYKNLQWVSYGEHGLLDSGKKIYLYNPEDDSMKNFESIQQLSDFLNVDLKPIKTTVYFSEPKFTLDNGMNIHEVNGLTHNGHPIFIAIDTEEKGLTLFEVLLLGGAFLWELWKDFKERTNNNLTR